MEIPETKLIGVIHLLEQEKPITKKKACEMLGITYNTKRLDAIISEYKDGVARDTKLRKEKRNKPTTLDEIKYIVESFLEGKSLIAISKATYRSPLVIKRILARYNLREEQTDFPFIDSELKKGDYVYSVKYNSMAEVQGVVIQDTIPIYNLFVFGSWQCRAYQPFYELIDMRKLQTELGIQLKADTGKIPTYIIKD